MVDLLVFFVLFSTGWVAYQRVVRLQARSLNQSQFVEASRSIGAAFASHQASHLSMDIVSRFVNPRTRQIMRIVLAVFTIFAAYLLLRSGFRLEERVAMEGGRRGVISIEMVAMMIPVGAGLIMFHTLIRLLIDIDYLRRGKQPPEKAMTGH